MQRVRGKIITPGGCWPNETVANSLWERGPGGCHRLEACATKVLPSLPDPLPHPHVSGAQAPACAAQARCLCSRLKGGWEGSLRGGKHRRDACATGPMVPRSSPQRPFATFSKCPTIRAPAAKTTLRAGPNGGAGTPAPGCDTPSPGPQGCRPPECPRP